MLVDHGHDVRPFIVDSAAIRSRGLGRSDAPRARGRLVATRRAPARDRRSAGTNRRSSTSTTRCRCCRHRSTARSRPRTRRSSSRSTTTASSARARTCSATAATAPTASDAGSPGPGSSTAATGTRWRSRPSSRRCSPRAGSPARGAGASTGSSPRAGSWRTPSAARRASRSHRDQAELRGRRRRSGRGRRARGCVPVRRPPGPREGRRARSSRRGSACPTSTRRRGSPATARRPTNSPRSAAADPRVVLLGRLGRDALFAELGRARALIFPSIWREPFGLTVIEAFARGTPVIAARHGAPADLVEDGRTGLFFRPGDAGRSRRADHLGERPCWRDGRDGSSRPPGVRGALHRRGELHRAGRRLPRRTPPTSAASRPGRRRDWRRRTAVELARWLRNRRASDGARSGWPAVPAGRSPTRASRASRTSRSGS